MVMTLLHERHRQLLRVLETGQDTNGQLDLSLLDRLQVQSVTALRIQYSVKAFNHEVSSDPEDVPAKFQAADGVLYFVRRGGNAPWASIARELAIALCPEADPGRLAAGIKEVLAAPSDRARRRRCWTNLGFAPLAVADEKPEVAVELSRTSAAKMPRPKRFRLSPSQKASPRRRAARRRRMANLGMGESVSTPASHQRRLRARKRTRSR